MRWSAETTRALARCLAATLLVVCATLGPTAPPIRAAGTSIAMNPSKTTVKPGEHFRIDVVLNTDTPTRGLQLGFKFDPSLVQVERVSNGAFYASWATAHGASTASPVPFRPNNDRGEVVTGAVVVLGGPATEGPTGSGAVLSLQLVARDGVSGRSPLDFSTGIVSNTRAQTIPDVAATGGLIFVGMDDDGSAPRTGQLVDINAPPPDIVPSGPSVNTQGVPTSPPAVALVPTLDPGVVARSAAQSVEVAPTVEATAPPTEPTPKPQPAPPTAPPTTVPLPQVLEATPVVMATAAPAPETQPPEPAAQATPTASAPTTAVNAPQVNLLATMMVLATAQAAPQATATPAPAAAPALRPLAATSPVSRLQPAAAPVVRPAASAGLFVPWEVVAGVGGGLISAALVLYAFRRPTGGRP